MSRMGARAVAHVTTAAALVLCAIAFGATAAPANAAQPLTRGFSDDVWFTGTAAVNTQWVARTQATGATRALLEVDWLSVEPNAPKPPSDPSSASDPQYDFGYLDARVREFAGSGITPVFLVTDAPQWAETPGGPAALEAGGAWEPNAAAFGQVATALAKRYSGSYPDPLNPGHNLPRVRYFQAWAEPNLSLHIAPQWTKSGGQLIATGPSIYRSLLNAFYAGIKSVEPSDVVITGGFAPFGDPPSLSPTTRMHPALFVRDLLCLNGRAALRPQQCPNPAHFDALASDPYEVSSPTTPAINADDVSAPDLGKLTRIVNKALRLGRALPRRHKQLWVTEFGYDSNPPNPNAVSLATQARWLEESFYVFWHQGVNTVFWYLVRDQPGRNFGVSYYSGVYFNGGRKKPSFEAYRFPLVVMPAGHSAQVWGISPRGGKVAVERQHGRSWKTLFLIEDSAGGVFVRTVSASLRGNFRAVVGGETSLTWRR